MGGGAGAKIAVRRLAELAPRAGLEVVEGPTGVDAAQAADELLIVGMPFCVLGVCELDGRTVPSRGAREQLLAGWSDSAGLDLLEQARAHKPRWVGGL